MKLQGPMRAVDVLDTLAWLDTAARDRAMQHGTPYSGAYYRAWQWLTAVVLDNPAAAPAMARRGCADQGRRAATTDWRQGDDHSFAWQANHHGRLGLDDLSCVIDALRARPTWTQQTTSRTTGAGCCFA